MTQVHEWVPIDLGIEELDALDAGPDDVAPQRLRVPRRVRKRRLLLLPVAVTLLAVGGKLLSMAWFAREGASSYDSGEYRSSREDFGRLRFANVVAPWKAWFNIGDARYRLGDLGGAEAAFLRALSEDTGRCETRFNLAVTIEAQGDRLMGNNVRDVTDSDKLDGLARYRVALDIVNAATCPSTGTDSPGQRLADTRERLEAKLGADQSPQDETQIDNPNDDEQEQGQETDENQTLQNRIQERNESGEQERQDASDIDPTGEQEPNDPNW